MSGGSAPYRRGRAFELEVRHALEAVGYTVTRAFLSRGVYDLVAVRSVAKGEVLFVQCKKDGACAPAGWNALWEVASTREAIPLIAARAARQPLKLWKITAPKLKRGRNPWVAWEP